jgi:chromosome segregation ATPase
MPARFARLRIAGFKSFADPTVVEILPGLTGVVGPNGCGKSNVIEALRWAMGEANARAMRGAEMEDVIFAGTAGRASRNLAEVTLTLEDTAGGAGQRPGGPRTRRADPVRRSGIRRAGLGNGQPGARGRAGQCAAG